MKKMKNSHGSILDLKPFASGDKNKYIHFTSLVKDDCEIFSKQQKRARRPVSWQGWIMPLPAPV